MANIRKVTFGIQPIEKVFRLQSLGGSVTDAVLGLRLDKLPNDFFEEATVSINARNGYRLTGRKSQNTLFFSESSVEFTHDHYEAENRFDLDRVMEEFRTIWSTINSVVTMTNIRRIGMVAECTYTVPAKTVSTWMRDRLLSPAFESGDLVSEKVLVRFEERSLGTDGLPPDSSKSDFLNTIYQVYDASQDDTHPQAGLMTMMVDAQRYFAPVITGKAVSEELSRLRRHFDVAFRKMDQQLLNLGASHGKNTKAA